MRAPIKIALQPYSNFSPKKVTCSHLFYGFRSLLLYLYYQVKQMQRYWGTIASRNAATSQSCTALPPLFPPGQRSNIVALRTAVPSQNDCHVHVEAIAGLGLSDRVAS